MAFAVTGRGGLSQHAECRCSVVTLSCPISAVSRRSLRITAPPPHQVHARASFSSDAHGGGGSQQQRCDSAVTPGVCTRGCTEAAPPSHHAWIPAASAAVAFTAMASFCALGGCPADAASVYPVANAQPSPARTVTIDRDKVEQLIQQRVAARLHSLSDDEVADIMMQLLLGGDVPSGLLDMQPAPALKELASPPSPAEQRTFTSPPPVSGLAGPNTEFQAPMPSQQPEDTYAPDTFEGFDSGSEYLDDDTDRTPWASFLQDSNRPSTSLSSLQSRVAKILQRFPDLKSEALQGRSLPRIPYLSENASTAIVVGVPVLTLILATRSFIALVNDIATRRLPQLSDQIARLTGLAPEQLGTGEDGGSVGTSASPPPPAPRPQRPPSSAGSPPASGRPNGDAALNGSSGVLWERQDDGMQPSSPPVSKANGDAPTNVLWVRDSPTSQPSPPPFLQGMEPAPSRRRAGGDGQEARGGPTSLPGGPPRAAGARPRRQVERPRRTDVPPLLMENGSQQTSEEGGRPRSPESLRS